MSYASWVPLLNIQRQGLTERTIFGGIALSTLDRPAIAIGYDQPLFGRSLLKPMQMKPIVGELDSALNEEQKALALASHVGSPHACEIAQHMVAPQSLRFLKVPESLPWGMSQAGQPKSQWCHPCSGKHAAILKACEINGWPLETYLDPAHPYNRAVLGGIEKRLHISFAKGQIAVDGCGLPTPALTLPQHADLFRMLCEEKDADWIWKTFQRYPHLIGGEMRLDTHLIQTQAGILAKEGADGLLGLSLIHPQWNTPTGVVVKLAHGYDMPTMWQIAYALLKRWNIEFSQPPPLDRQTVQLSTEFASWLEQISSPL